jgi:hypothetical protein
VTAPGAGQPGLGQVPLPSFDYSSVRNTVISYRLSPGVSYTLDKRSSIEADYRLNYSGYTGVNTRTQGIGGSYRRGISRYGTFRAGYRYVQADYPQFAGTPQIYRLHLIDVGGNYARSLSFSRNTTFSFTVGSSVMDLAGSTDYRMTGSANLNHQLNRTWELHLNYFRGMTFIDGFGQPFFSDTVSGGALGDVVAPLSLSATAGYSRGSGQGLSSSGFASYHGRARLQAPLTNLLSAFGEYFYFHYDYGAGVPVLIRGFAAGINRHGVRGGVALAVTPLD